MPRGAFGGAERRQPEREALVRKGLSAAGGWGVGAADSSDGWLRPLGGGGGPGSRRRGWLAPRPREQREPRRRAKWDCRTAKGLLRAHESLHPPQRVRSVRGAALRKFSRRDPVPEASLGKRTGQTRRTRLSRSQLGNLAATRRCPEERVDREGRRGVPKKEPTGGQEWEGGESAK